MTHRSFDHTEDVSWMTEAACKGLYDVMFPKRGESTALARATCAICPVQAECLAYAMTHSERFGIWGDTSERARRRMREGRQKIPREFSPSACGTIAGYKRHYRAGITPCDQCREAHRVYQQAGRSSRAIAS